MLACLDAFTADGLSVAVPVSAIRALSPDDELVDSTLLFLDHTVLKVNEAYESLIDRLASEWTARS